MDRGLAAGGRSREASSTLCTAPGAANPIAEAGKMAGQLQLTRGDFDLLVQCPLSHADYVAKLVARGVLRLD